MECEALESNDQYSTALRESEKCDRGFFMGHGEQTVRNLRFSAIQSDEVECFRPSMEEGRTLTSQNFGEVSIVSPDPVVRAFLQGILRFQGFQSKDLSGRLDGFWNDGLLPGQVVFLDSTYLGSREESHHIGEWLQECSRNGVHFIVLADKKKNAIVDEFFQHRACQILWKPLDYRKIGQAMAHVWSR